jgi:hypothetical protein
MADKLERVALLTSEVQARLLETMLKEHGIPHVIQDYHSHALDGIFQASSGWGHVETPPRFKEQVLALLDAITQEMPARNKGMPLDLAQEQVRFWGYAFLFGAILLATSCVGCIMSLGWWAKCRSWESALAVGAWHLLCVAGPLCVLGLASRRYFHTQAPPTSKRRARLYLILLSGLLMAIWLTAAAPLYLR